MKTYKSVDEYIAAQPPRIPGASGENQKNYSKGRSRSSGVYQL